MKLKSIISFLFSYSLLHITLIGCFGANLNDGSRYNSESRDFLDIIIDKSHAYTYLGYTDDAGRNYSIYSSLMPKNNATRKNLEGIERFPIILDCLLNDENIQKFSINEIPESLSFKELVSAFLFSIYYLLSNYIETSDEGRIVNDRPIRKNIIIQRRFYLTLEQLEKAKAVISHNFIESDKGNILYDALKYNCVDYVKDIYMAIGLDETQGEFFSQFDTHKYELKETKKPDTSFSLLKLYEIHNNGKIGPLRIAKAIWNGCEC